MDSDGARDRTETQKRKRDVDLDSNDRPAKRIKLDLNEEITGSTLDSLPRDTLIGVTQHLDLLDILSLFSVRKSMANPAFFGSTEEQDQMWREIFSRRHSITELTVPKSTDKSLWRILFACVFSVKDKPLKVLERTIQNSAEQKTLSVLTKLSFKLAKLQQRQILVDQVFKLFKTYPSLKSLWDMRVFYSFAEVLPGLEWSSENYKWDVTSTFPVKMSIIGSNGKALTITALTSTFACYWAYETRQLIKPAIVSIEDIVNETLNPADQRYAEELLPFSPDEDNQLEMGKEGWFDIGSYRGTELKKLLVEIGLSELDPTEIKKFIERSCFPDLKCEYYTTTRGYFTTDAPKKGDRLPGVGGICKWGSLPPRS